MSDLEMVRNMLSKAGISFKELSDPLPNKHVATTIETDGRVTFTFSESGWLLDVFQNDLGQFI